MIVVRTTGRKGTADLVTDSIDEAMADVRTMVEGLDASLEPSEVVVVDVARGTLRVPQAAG